MPQAKHSPMVIAAARALCKRSSDDCRQDMESWWKHYREMYIADAQAAFDAAWVPALVDALTMASEYVLVEGDAAEIERVRAALTRATGA